MKAAIAQVVLIVLILGGYFAYRSSQPQQPSTNSYDLMAQAGRNLNYNAMQSRKQSGLLLGRLNTMAGQHYKDNETMQGHLKTAQSVYQVTAELLSQSEELRSEVIEQTGGFTDNKIGIKNNASLTVAEREKVMDLIISLKNYQEVVHKMMESKKLPSLLVDPEGNAVTAAEYANWYFANKPLSVFLLNLARMEADIVTLENGALQESAFALHFNSLEFDDLFPVVSPKALVVAEGDVFQAEISFAKKLSNFEPSYITANKEAAAIEEGVGSISVDIDRPFEREDGKRIKQIKASIGIPAKHGTSSHTGIKKVKVD